MTDNTGTKTEERVVKTENDSEDQEMTDRSELVHKQTCFLLFTKFTKEVRKQSHVW